MFMPKYNIAIEYQGGQHFKPVNNFGGFTSFLTQIKLDYEKKEKCDNNDIKLLYFTYKKYEIPKNYIDIVYSSETDLLNIINNIIKDKE